MPEFLGPWSEVTSLLLYNIVLVESVCRVLVLAELVSPSHLTFLLGVWGGRDSFSGAAKGEEKDFGHDQPLPAYRQIPQGNFWTMDTSLTQSQLDSICAAETLSKGLGRAY